MAACYIPPVGSVQLDICSADKRFALLAARIAAAQAAGAVLVAGDFNARVGALSGACGAGAAAGHGVRLNGLCAAAGLTLCTGDVPGDLMAPPSFCRGDERSRPNHIVACASARPWLQHCCVSPHRRGSDHHPLEARLAVPWVAQAPQPATGTPLRRVRWNPTQAPAYSAALQPAALEAVCAAAAAGDVNLCFTLFHAELTRAAAAGDMPLRVVRSGSGRIFRPAWFDAECRALRAAAFRALKHQPHSDDARALKRRYFSVTRCKRRAWEREHAQELLRELRADPRALFRRARLVLPRLPVTLQDPARWQEYVERLAHGPAQPPLALPPAVPGQPQVAPAAALAAPFTEDEVLVALRGLNNGRSPGASGLPAELLRYALGQPPEPTDPPPRLLLPALTAMFNCWLRAGAVPAAANCSLVVPIYKRGAAAEPDNYRPIAVGEPVLRLFAGVINARLVTHTEAAGLRAPSQAGFRPGVSTVHQAFALQHLVDRAARLRRPLFCCFLDLKGAYDRVPRALLWQALARLGVPAGLLAAIQSLYQHAEYAISAGGRRGAGVPSVCGVKQGCPLSPTLFGLLLDGLHWALMAGAPAAGPALACGRRVPDLGYADDFCLLASSAATLQRLLDIAYGFLDSIGIELSFDKTKVVAFGRASAAAAAAAPAWTYGGHPLQCAPDCKYLGVTFSADSGIAATFLPLSGKLHGAWATLQQRFGEVHDGISLALMRALFQSAVPPAGSYACEVWGVRSLRGQAAADRRHLAQTHLQL